MINAFKTFSAGSTKALTNFIILVEYLLENVEYILLYLESQFMQECHIT